MPGMLNISATISDVRCNSNQIFSLQLLIDLIASETEKPKRQHFKSLELNTHYIQLLFMLCKRRIQFTKVRRGEVSILRVVSLTLFNLAQCL